MIINIRGTSGSGKSWVVYQLFEIFGNQPIRGRNGKIIAHSLPAANTVALGKYISACGGCDTIKLMDDVAPLIDRYCGSRHVIFEGYLISTIAMRWLDYASKVQDFRWMFLDTPIKECIAHVEARREAVGNVKVLDPKNLILKHELNRTIYGKALARRLPNVFKVDSSDEALNLVRSWLEPRRIVRVRH